MGIGFGNLRFLNFAGDQSPDIGVIRKLIEVAGNTRLTKQRKCLGSPSSSSLSSAR